MAYTYLFRFKYIPQGIKTQKKHTKKHKIAHKKIKPHVFLLGVKVLQGWQNAHGPIEAHVVLPGGLMTEHTFLRIRIFSLRQLQEYDCN